MKLFLLFLTFSFTQNLLAQNLVTNGNFEIPNICKKYTEECAPLGWRATTVKLFGYHITRTTLDSGAEKLDRYIKLLLFDESRANDRKFAQTQLICPLIKGEKYRLSIKVKPYKFWINQINFGFLEKLILSKKVNLDEFKTNIVSLEVPTKIIDEQWYLFEIEYTATGKEKYLLIGNLFPDNLTKVEPIDRKKFKRTQKRYQPKKKVEYGFDDIQILKISQDLSHCKNAGEREKQIHQYNIRHSLALPSPPIKDTMVTPIDTIVVPVVESVIEKPIQTKRPEKIVLSDVLFEFNESTLKPASLEALDEIIRFLKVDPTLQARIMGYTDDRGTKEYNLNLSKLRADAVKAYLITQGLSANRLIAIGKGENEPIDSNETDEGRRKNRRVEVDFYW